MRLAVIDLGLPDSERGGRVFLERALLERFNVVELEQQLDAQFMDAEDAGRMVLIEALLQQQDSLEVAVFPSEEPPIVYHAYIKDPKDSDTRLFACVLVPEPVVHSLVEQSPRPVFETATFQVMAAGATPAAMSTALESWARRVWVVQEEKARDLFSYHLRKGRENQAGS